MRQYIILAISSFVVTRVEEPAPPLEDNSKNIVANAQ